MKYIGPTLLFIVGILLIVAEANALLVIPSISIWLCFIFGFLMI